MQYAPNIWEQFKVKLFNKTYFYNLEKQAYSNKLPCGKKWKNMTCHSLLMSIIMGTPVEYMQMHLLYLLFN